MLRDVIAFIRSRTDLSRETALREINFAWKEIWASQDLPNSIFELTAVPDASAQRISLPYYVGTIRAVKANCSRERIELNTPRPAYQDKNYFQSPFTWAVLGKSSFNKTITNATTIAVSIAKAESTRFTVSLSGPTDNATETREQLVFDIGDTSHETLSRFTDAYISKDQITASNVVIKDYNGVELGLIPNGAFDGLNTIIQIIDKCTNLCCSSSVCNCFDILYKLACPYLYYDETFVAQEETLMAKTLEWITLPKEGGEAKAKVYAEKASQLAANSNNEELSITHHMDLGANQFVTQYRGLI